MKSTIVSRRKDTVVIVSAIAAVVSVILRIINFFFFYDSEAVYYSTGAPLPIISDCLMYGAVLYLAFFSVLKFKKKTLKAADSPLALRICSIAVATASFVMLTVTDLIDAATQKAPLSVLLAALSLISAAYFVLAIFKTNVAYTIICGILAIIRVVIMLASSYFNQSVAMNTPDKLIYGVACICVMLFIVSELKLTVKAPRSWLYVFSAAATAIICSTASIPSIIAYFTGKLPEESGLFSEYFVLMGIAIYAMIRLINVSGETRRMGLVSDIKSELASEETPDSEVCSEDTVSGAEAESSTSDESDISVNADSEQ